MAALFPNSTFVPVTHAGQETVFQTQCVKNLASHFIETLQVGDIGCTRTPESIFSAVGRFPLLAKDARPADVDPNGTNQIGIAERKVATVAVATATDAETRSLLIYFSGGAGNGACLRAGTFQTTFNGGLWTTTLTNCEFARDVIVKGVSVSFPDNSFVADSNRLT